jgi:hypothetical protein
MVIGGYTLMVTGVFALCAITALSKEIMLARLCFAIGIVMVALGGVAVAVATFMRYGRALDEAYRLGYDVGHERGYKEGAADEARLHDGGGA